MITIVANHVPTKNTNNVWVVYIEGQEDSRQFCKSPRNAMKYMFLLKSRTQGSRISDECLKALSAAIKEQRLQEHPEEAAMAAKIQEVTAAIAEAHDVNRILAEKPKKKRKAAEASEEKPKRRGRKPKAVQAA